MEESRLASDAAQMGESKENRLGRKRRDQRDTARDEYQRDGAAPAEIRGKEVPARGFGGADGLGRARQQRQHVQGNEPELNVNAGDELSLQ